jgi:hypothetical protein
MSKPLEHTVPTPMAWCGRSWQGLVERRHEAFQHALALRDATDRNSGQVVSDFLAFFDDTRHRAVQRRRGMDLPLAATNSESSD